MAQTPLQAAWLIISAAEGFWIPLELLTPATRRPRSLKTYNSGTAAMMTTHSCCISEYKKLS